jgi:hypothetical protein
MKRGDWKEWGLVALLVLVTLAHIGLVVWDWLR